LINECDAKYHHSRYFVLNGVAIAWLGHAIVPLLGGEMASAVRIVIDYWQVENVIDNTTFSRG